MQRLLWCVCVVACASASSAPLTGSDGSAGSDNSLVNVGRAAFLAGAGSVVPWAVIARTDDPPTLAQRHALADAACPKVTAPFFYRVEKDGQTSWLLGTRHVGISFAKFPDVVHDTLHQAKLVVYEIAPGDHSKTDETPKVSIPDLLGPEGWAHYRELVGSRVAEKHREEHLLLASLLLAFVWDDPSALLEKEIQKDLEPLHMPQQGLETADFQHDLAVKMFDDRMLKASVMGTKDRDELRSDKEKSIKSYCDGTKEEELFDDHTRAELHKVGYTDKDITAFENAMVYDRNASWIPKLEDMFAKGGVFVAVGAAHLRGPKGVPALLTKRGWKVTRVTPP